MKTRVDSLRGQVTSECFAVQCYWVNGTKTLVKWGKG